MNLRSRLDRLEQRANTSGKIRLPLEVFYGLVPIEQLDEETRKLVEPIFDVRQDQRDWVEELIANPTMSLPLT